MISLHDWEVIRSLARSGVPKAQIARDLGLARNTVARAVGRIHRRVSTVWEGFVF